MARIERLLEEADRQVRVAVIRVPSESLSKVLRCQLNCLYPLEIEYAATVDPVNDISPQKTNENAQVSLKENRSATSQLVFKDSSQSVERNINILAFSIVCMYITFQDLGTVWTLC